MQALLKNKGGQKKLALVSKYGTICLTNYVFPVGHLITSCVFKRQKDKERRKKVKSMQFVVYDLGTVCSLTRLDANRLIPCACLVFLCECVWL